jgi:ADP-ribosylglycohydrolase
VTGLVVGHPDRVRGCLLGGAVGDALGWPVEFLSWPQIQHRYGGAGITAPSLTPAGYAEITDDTQMTLFTMEGLIDAGPGAEPDAVVTAVYRAHLRWYATQVGAGSPGSPAPAGPAGPLGRRLAEQGWLHSRRAPGNACLSGLASGRMGTPEQPMNPDSKGCGAVMRSAPFGLDPTRSAEQSFDLAVRCAAQTHGHPTGYLAAGAFAAMIRTLLDGRDLRYAVRVALELLADRPGHGETSAALRAAEDASDGRPIDVEAVESLGGGWVAEEALAIGVACALAHPDDAGRALTVAVNHSGDSDSTGSVCGNLLGAARGESVLPAAWVSTVEGEASIRRLADVLVAGATRPPAGS